MITSLPPAPPPVTPQRPTASTLKVVHFLAGVAAVVLFWLVAANFGVKAVQDMNIVLTLLIFVLPPIIVYRAITFFKLRYVGIGVVSGLAWLAFLVVVGFGLSAIGIPQSITGIVAGLGAIMAMAIVAVYQTHPEWTVGPTRKTMSPGVQNPGSPLHPSGTDPKPPTPVQVIAKAVGLGLIAAFFLFFAGIWLVNETAWLVSKTPLETEHSSGRSLLWFYSVLATFGAFVLTRATIRGYLQNLHSNLHRTDAEPAKAVPVLERTALVAASVAVVASGILVYAWSVRSSAFALGITREQLTKASVTVKTCWKDRTSESAATESAAVYARRGNMLYLVSNDHVLNLQALADAAIIRAPLVRDFTAIAIFPSGQQRSVKAFAVEAAYLDLTLLQVDAEGLVEGKDYVVLPNGKDLRIKEGDEVVAVGSPFAPVTLRELEERTGPSGIKGSQRFGHVSAFRKVIINNHDCIYVQTDAAINHGNSGGPLLVAHYGRFVWIGINTCGLMPGDGSAGPNSAIHARHIDESRFKWHVADKWGAAEAIRMRFKGDATAQ